MKNNLLIGIVIVAALAIGFLIGISVESPRLNKNNVSGTIGKVNNYRNTKTTEADIELKNELLADSLTQKLLVNYMNFFYARSCELGNNIDFATREAIANEAFKSKNGQLIDALEAYGKFLGSARKDLLLVVANCQSLEKAEPVFLRSSIAQANNTIAQMSFKNSVVLQFITGLESFIQENGVESSSKLAEAHDLLTYNEISASLALKDKVLLKYFDKKKLYSKGLKSSEQTNYKEIIERDMESLGANDSEKLGGIVYTDVEKLGFKIFDNEKLGTGFTDSEKLGAVEMDTEKLGGTGVWDAEKLGVWNDSEQLGWKDSEELKGILDI